VEQSGVCTRRATPVSAIRRGCERHKVRHVLAPAPPQATRGVGVQPPARGTKEEHGSQDEITKATNRKPAQRTEPAHLWWEEIHVAAFKVAR
jgi:hypothetical protein